MSAIIQVSAIEGRIIEAARWEVKNIINLREGHNFQLSIETKDTSLLGYLGKTNNPDCQIDSNNKNYSIVLTCLVKQIRHMLEVTDNDIESMAVIMPTNRIVQNVLTYLLEPTKCDPRFIALLKVGQEIAVQKSV